VEPEVLTCACLTLWYQYDTPGLQTLRSEQTTHHGSGTHTANTASNTAHTANNTAHTAGNSGAPANAMTIYIYGDTEDGSSSSSNMRHGKKCIRRSRR
jgi:hypothetical protein